MRIDKSIFRYIEHELYSYEQTKKDLETYKEQILDSTPKPEASSRQGLSDTTASKAMKLSSSAFIIQAERTIEAIDKSLAMLSDGHRQIFELKYQNCMPWQEIAIEMGISDRTYFRLRRELVAMVGQQMGILNIGEGR
jgi:RinA family phage transcriptional activator